MRSSAFNAQPSSRIGLVIAHIVPEKREVMPLAVRVLSPADWEELDDTTVLDPNPLTCHPPEAEYRALFDRILSSVPASFGLGEPRPEARS